VNLNYDYAFIIINNWIKI